MEIDRNKEKQLISVILNEERPPRERFYRPELLLLYSSHHEAELTSFQTLFGSAAVLRIKPGTVNFDLTFKGNKK
uniref:Uncharacterized protein n=1 Tax=Timema genevievae TaxID=629358 RepID=A0A7R9PRP8_TIMGE|nr:unnamed protein product [Timema genevievae]